MSHILWYNVSLWSGPNYPAGNITHCHPSHNYPQEAITQRLFPSPQWFTSSSQYPSSPINTTSNVYLWKGLGNVQSPPRKQEMVATSCKSKCQNALTLFQTSPTPPSKSHTQNAQLTANDLAFPDSDATVTRDVVGLDETDQMGDNQDEIGDLRNIEQKPHISILPQRHLISRADMCPSKHFLIHIEEHSDCQYFNLHTG